MRRVLNPWSVAPQTHYHSAEWYIRQGLPVPAGVTNVRCHVLFPQETFLPSAAGIGGNALGHTAGKWGGS